MTRQPNSSNPSPDQPDIRTLRQALEQGMLKQVQMQKLIWNLVKMAGGQIVVDTATTDPLWDLHYAKVEGSQTSIKMIAATLPEASEAQLLALVERLVGTKNNPQDEALSVGLVDYPIAYLSARLSQHLEWKGDTWQSKAPPAPSTP